MNRNPGGHAVVVALCLVPLLAIALALLLTFAGYSPLSALAPVRP